MKRLTVLLCALVLAAGPAAAGGLTAEQRLALDAFRQATCASSWSSPSRCRPPTSPSPAPTASRRRSPPRTAGSGSSTSGPPGARPAAARCRRSTRSPRERGGDDLAVIAIATGRNAPEAIAAFREEAGVTTLATYTDPKSELARAMDVPGLPVTVILDRDGDEIARLLGDADWNGAEARALIDYLAGLPGS